MASSNDCSLIQGTVWLVSYLAQFPKDNKLPNSPFLLPTKSSEMDIQISAKFGREAEVTTISRSSLEVKRGEDKAALFCSTASCSAYTARSTVRQLSSLGIMGDSNGERGYYVERDRGGAAGQRPKLIENQASLTLLFTN